MILSLTYPDHIDLYLHFFLILSHVPVQEHFTKGSQTLKEWVKYNICLLVFIGHAFSESTKYRLYSTHMKTYNLIDKVASATIFLYDTPPSHWLSITLPGHNLLKLLEDSVTHRSRSMATIKHNYTVQMTVKEKIFSLENDDHQSDLSSPLALAHCPPWPCLAEIECCMITCTWHK